MNKVFILPLAFVLLGCGAESTQKELASDSLQKDSMATTIISSQSFPLVIDDSTTRDSVSLNASFVQKCIPSMESKDEGNWIVGEYLSIDSLKVNGQYEAYVKGLDIGQMKETQAFVYDTLAYANGKAYVWGISYSSYEACPYYQGKSIFLTTVSNEGIYKNTVRILEISSGGDPPSFGSNWGRCELDKNFQLSCADTSLSGEYMDDGYEEAVMVPGIRTYQITSEGFIKSLQNLKGKEIKKRKKSSNS